MITPKAAQIAKDIDAARCKGAWQAIPELARRYRKHHPEGAALEQTVLAEAAMTLLHPLDNEPSFANDSPQNVSTHAIFDPSQVRLYQEQLQTVLDMTPAGPCQEFANVILARSYYACGDYKSTLEIVEQLSFNKDDVSVDSGYGFVLFLQARAIKAISLERTDRAEEALQSYEGVVTLLNESVGSYDRVLVDWAEEALYRGSFLALRERTLASVETTLTLLRTYQKVTATQPLSWRLDKRMALTNYTIQYFSEIYRCCEYIPSLELASGNQDDGKSDIHLLFVAEQLQLYTIYETMLDFVALFPRAGEVNTPVLQFVDQLAADFDFLGKTTNDLRGFIETLNRASQKTFNSPLITRHLFHALVRLGEYTEAEHALQLYLYLVGLTSQEWKETRRNGDALAIDTNGKSIPIPVQSSTSSKDSLANMRSIEKETTEDTLAVLLTAIKMYCNELSRGAEAVEMADIAHYVLQKPSDQLRNDDRWCRFEVEVYRAIGVAYGCLATQTHDPDTRSTYQHDALRFLNMAIEKDQESWETHYQLALQRAEMHDIEHACRLVLEAMNTLSIRKAGLVDPRQDSLWHFLVLLLSCPVMEKDFQKALQICDENLQDISADAIPDSQLSYSGLGSATLAVPDEVEQSLLFEVTRVMLIDRLRGPDAALESQERLFQAAGKLAGIGLPDASSATASVLNEPLAYHQPGMVVSGSLGNLSEIHLAEQKRRGRSASSSVVGSQLPLPIIASRSHDNVHSNNPLINRARSASSLSNKSAATSTLTVPTEPSPQPPSNHHHHLHLFSSRSASRKAKKEEAAESLAPASKTSLLSVSHGKRERDSVMADRVDIRTIHATGTSKTSLFSANPSMTSVKTILQPNLVPTRPTTRSVLRKERSERLLSNLWLLSASAFLKLGHLDESLKAIAEAENMDGTTNARVWCLLGRLRLAEQQTDLAISSFQKGLIADPNDVECRVWLAKTYMEGGDHEIAEGLLEAVTKGTGWDCAEAWFYLGNIYQETGRVEHTKRCLLYALDLESTRPIQPFSILPRFV